MLGLSNRNMNRSARCSLALVLLLSFPAYVAVAATNNSPLWAQMQSAVLKDDSLDEVKALVKEGFDINSPIGCGSFSALDGAVSRSNVDMVKWLLANGSKAKGSALLEAVRCRNLDVSSNMVEALLKAGADANYKEDYPNPSFHSAIPLTTPLHTACYLSNWPVVKLLLSWPGIELNTLDVDSHTPLMWAVEKDDIAEVEMLLAAGADPNVKNNKGETAFSVAEKQIGLQKNIINLLQSRQGSR